MGDFIEADLGSTFATDIGIADRFVIQKPFGQAVHVMSPVRFEDIGFQQGIVNDPLQPDTVIGEHMAVILEILADFVFLRVFQPGFEFVENGLQWKLLALFHAVMSERNVSGMTGFDGEGNSDEVLRS